MFTWIIDYFYTIAIVTLFLISPILIFIIRKRVSKNTNKFTILLWSFISFSVGVIILLLVKEFHISMIQSICFEYPTMNYKTEDIPQGCYDFKMNKYMGVGWTVSAIFWIFIELLYLGIVYMFWSIKKRIQKQK